MAKPFQFRLRTIFLLTALAAVLCLVAPPIWKAGWPPDADPEEKIIPLLLFWGFIAMGLAVNVVNIIRE